MKDLEKFFDPVTYVVDQLLNPKKPVQVED